MTRFVVRLCAFAWVLITCGAVKTPTVTESTMWNANEQSMAAPIVHGLTKRLYLSLKIPR